MSLKRAPKEEHGFAKAVLTLIAILVVALLCQEAFGATWTFTVPGSLIDDSYMNGYAPSRNTNYEGLTGFVLGYSGDAITGVIGSPNISDSLAAHTGTLDSFKVVLKMATKFSDFIDGDSIKINFNALKVIPVISEVTDSSYAYGYHWQGHGATGANDQYTPNESDGVHGDSVIVRYGTALGDSITLWGDPDHAGAEWWVIRATVMAVSVDARFYARSTEYGTVSQQPYFIFYGTEGTSAPVTYTATKKVCKK